MLEISKATAEVLLKDNSINNSIEEELLNTEVNFFRLLISKEDFISVFYNKVFKVKDNEVVKYIITDLISSINDKTILDYKKEIGLDIEDLKDHLRKVYNIDEKINIEVSDNVIKKFKEN